MDHEEDDDVNFAKWMSSFWGHSVGEERPRERRPSWRRSSRPPSDRRASLPCPAQLDAMHLRQLQAAATTPSPGHPGPRDEKDVRPHPKARRTSSTDESRRKSSVPENHFTPIRELSESFERRLHFRSRHAVSLGAADELCVICHDELSTGGVRELQCAHRFHKEGDERQVSRQPSLRRQR
ncbi:leukemia NUP98 fusion partner 1 isoform X2 [Lepisosteus oculatus]|uniref:Si:ch211-207l14.1 n=1 Tax=Lepisosteus oculatus TaxID=7918 RepID=W5MX91_LEPOC|nr:PREDICTED: leukemia NUP98 fusion partner 1 isoform X2 [Lepisosteus oculatus]